MGGKPTQVNTGQATAADAGATKQAEANAALANQNAAYQRSAMSTLFGIAPGQEEKGVQSSGSLSGMLDPNKLNVSGPTGSFKLQYDQGNKAIDTQLQNGVGSLARESANRGFGADANFVADQGRQNYLGAAAAKGANFADAATKSYADAKDNFWNANNLLAGQGANAGSNAITANTSAGNTYANLYGVAGQQAKPTGFGNALVGALGVAGAGAMSAWCPVEDSLVTLADGAAKKVQDLDFTKDLILQSDGTSRLLDKAPTPHFQEALEVETQRGKKGRVSRSHAYIVGYGYQTAGELVVDGSTYLRTDEVERDAVKFVSNLGLRRVFSMPIGGNHTYCVDGIWSIA